MRGNFQAERNHAGLYRETCGASYGPYPGIKDSVDHRCAKVITIDGEDLQCVRGENHKGKHLTVSGKRF